MCGKHGQGISLITSARPGGQDVVYLFKTFAQELMLECSGNIFIHGTTIITVSNDTLSLS
jgi:hypothetical protein